jgi:hypothetical protein
MVSCAHGTVRFLANALLAALLAGLTIGAAFRLVLVERSVHQPLPEALLCPPFASEEEYLNWAGETMASAVKTRDVAIVTRRRCIHA